MVATVWMGARLEWLYQPTEERGFAAGRLNYCCTEENIPFL
jgi:hypothetical protein